MNSGAQAPASTFQLHHSLFCEPKYQHLTMEPGFFSSEKVGLVQGPAAISTTQL
jgi:hypothetical protein